MWLLSAAVLLGLLKVLTHLDLLEMVRIADMSWWWVVGGFALSAAWFAYADYSGLTRRKATERIELRKQARLQKQRDMLKQGRRR
jgi:small Trp-rich protein